MKKITVAKAAMIMGVSQQFIRIGLQRGKLEFGVAVKMTGDRYTYYINPEKFNNYIKDLK